jgi:putative DNA primase/helicase
MRDGSAVPVKNPEHPDPLAEEIRWQITEGSLTQAIGRGRGANRSPTDPLAIDILTRICLPLDVDEVTTWDAVQPSRLQVMWARGAIPQSYTDKAACYPDLFVSAGAAEQAMRREGWEKTPYKSLLSKKRAFPIGICRGFSPQPLSGADAAPSTAEFAGFLSVSYRRSGSRGPAARLAYDPQRIPDPAAWLRERLGEVEILKS